MKTRRSKACDIPARVKKQVWSRDNGACVICGSTYNVMPSCHFVSRAKGGLGIEENIFTACTGFGNNCHYLFDSGDRETRARLRSKVRTYLKGQYPGWDESDLFYRK